MAPSALVLITDGNEEMEAVISIDILRRAGVDVTVAGLNGPNTVECSRHVKIVPDTGLSAVKDKTFDAILLPGGMGGAEAFSKSSTVHELLSQYYSQQKVVAIICASPIVLKAAQVAKGRSVTAHPSVKDQLVQDYNYKEERVVVDGNLITSRGPGTAFEFALAVVKKLQGPEKLKEIVPPMICNDEIVKSV
ncbi:DJ-1 family protein [Spizellomyces punctatus DAOM BR117]|uniref:D-lactate dehydratase n=1 Tax=Spizellomyces punctatus (strain DAOM BR117) TaxID=645134 RepID=A0A0L0HGD3_SPIPD|nr:DJ-1 family protein [Spizellomyces punctatus DAOM BR117]KND00062.1 DJ-1 family protein [Spizellomyces punctatus DAOM BR117]|eukprot:XP_016608101.1 DJ-1 family protein [Spizellomyces punctatus DAOM BR117]